MSSLNKVFLMGNLTATPELRYTPAGTAVTRMGLAVNRRYKASDGAVKEEVLYIDVDAFARQAETAARFLTKGSPIHIEGRLKLNSWETREGAKKTKITVVADHIQFLTRKRDAAADATAAPASEAAAVGVAPEEQLPGDEDVPF